MTNSNYSGPAKFRPLSPWAYFGYGLLYSVPLLGLVMLIIHSISGANINRRNYARSYWCVYVITAIAAAILAATGLLGAVLGQ
ncbi:MAG: hypothetical protein ACOX17_10320 [Christensenellales bacterium]|jgi:hypothetical protein